MRRATMISLVLALMAVSGASVGPAGRGLDALRSAAGLVLVLADTEAPKTSPISRERRIAGSSPAQPRTVVILTRRITAAPVQHALFQRPPPAAPPATQS